MGHGKAMERYFFYVKESKTFKEKLKTLKELEKVGQVKEAMDGLDGIGEYYEIPKKYWPQYLYSYFGGLLKGSGVLPVQIGACKIESKSIKIDPPAVYIVLKDRIKKSQWLELWEIIQNMGSKKVGAKNTPQEARDIFEMFNSKNTRNREKDAFDRDFGWYKSWRAGKSPETIRREEKRPYELDTIKTGIKGVKKLLGKINVER